MLKIHAENSRNKTGDKNDARPARYLLHRRIEIVPNDGQMNFGRRI